MRNSPKSWLPAALLALAGCSLAPAPAPPPGPIPETWAQGETSAAPLPAAWWRTFGSPDIDALVEGALAANRDLAAALARIEQARAGVRIAGAGLWPRIDAAGTATDTRQSGSGTLTAITGPGTTRIGSDSGTSYHGQLQVAYEADLFGRVRAGRDAARGRLAASAFDHQALRLVTAAEVVQTALELAATERRLELGAANLDNARALLALLDARLAAGRSTALERDQQRTAVAGLEAEIAALGESRARQRHRLAVLSGAPSPDFAPPVPQWAQLRLPEVRPMVPAALLSRRPDLRRAEAELAAAGADLGAARAALYPSLEISWDRTWTDRSSATLTNLGASLLAPIFRGGALRGEVARSAARRRELAATYHQAVLTAFGEVSDALAAQRQGALRGTALHRAAAAARDAYAIARARFERGAVDYQALLEVQRTLIQAEDAEVGGRLAEFQAALALYRALGGGT